MTHNNNDFIKAAYDNLYSAFMRHDRKAIEYYCYNCEKLGIDQFHEKANKEAERMYSSIGVRTIPVWALGKQLISVLQHCVAKDDFRLAETIPNGGVAASG